ncbi:MAG: hypothetical protein Q9212_002680 [Teloschistes hypoglaucus]
MTHAFFAGMGGFVVDTNDPDRPPYIPDSPRLSITAQGIAILAECGQLPAISRGEIDDKNKANNAAKALALLQASWLLVQCIARTAAGLPLTLLELNTLAHTVCALAMYVLWWYKPYDVHEPVLLSGDWVRPLTSAMWMFSPISTPIGSLAEIEGLVQIDISTTPPQRNFPHRRSSHTTGGLPMPRDDGSEIIGDTCDSAGQAQLILLHSAGENNQWLNVTTSLDLRTGEKGPAVVEEGCPTLKHDQICALTGFGPRRENLPRRVRKYYREQGIKPTLPSIRLSRTTLTRWLLASSVMAQFPDVWYIYRQPYERHDGIKVDIPVFEYPLWRLKKRPSFLCVEADNFPCDDLLGRENQSLRTLLLSFATAAYGGLHAAAWKDYFPSTTERIMWRVSSVLIAASGAIASSFVGVGGLHSTSIVGGSIQGIIDKLVFSGVGYVFLVVSAVVCSFFVYAACRTFLVVEALISLRQLPVTMYETPRFSHRLLYAILPWIADQLIPPVQGFSLSNSPAPRHLRHGYMSQSLHWKQTQQLEDAHRELRGD